MTTRRHFKEVGNKPKMAYTKIEYRDWEFEADQQGTKDAYKTVQKSGAEACGCNNCKNFVAARQEIFPQEVLDLIRQLGVDYQKEADASEMMVDDKGHHQYYGIFHFKGKMLKGKDCAISLPSGGHNIELDEITPNFSIGFTSGKSLALLEDKDELVQIEFSVNIPWVINRELEGK